MTFESRGNERTRTAGAARPLVRFGVLTLRNLIKCHPAGG
jgi:hypothetical protein